MNVVTDTVNPDDFGVYTFSADTNIVSNSGAHLFYIGGSFDTLTSVGGDELVLATGGHATINLSGTGNNTVFLSDSSNVVDAGTGHNQITDAASTGDKMILPSAGSGFDAITLLYSSPSLDISAALRGTDWDGTQAHLSNYVTATSNNGTETISLSATAKGAAVAIASVSNPVGAAWDLSTVLSHLVT